MEPFLKWAGGKRWLISKGRNLFPDKSEFNCYFEPFLGSGAVFFHIQPSLGYISDLNSDLINAYVAIRDDWGGLLSILTNYDRKHNFDFYYKIRASKPRDPIKRAARFIYLNRTCWNGLYRVNRKGEFNVPIGSKTKVITSEDDFFSISCALQGIEISACDFDVTMDKAKEGDFVFIDPPYTVKHNLNGFIKYNETIFSWEDQVRLRNSIVKVVKRGASVLLSNADHFSIHELYRGIGRKDTLDRASVIAGKSSARGTYSELVIKC